jgi:hypothetical protein
MSYSLFFNKQKINFFIQGQDLNISFIFRNTFFVIILYKKEKNISLLQFHKYIFFRKSIGFFETITNIYNPNIYFIPIGFNPMLVKRKLNIKFLDIVEEKYSLKDQKLDINKRDDVKLKTKDYNLLSYYNLIKNQYKIKSKNYKLKSH